MSREAFSKQTGFTAYGETLNPLFGLSGSVGVFKLGDNRALELIQTLTDLSEANTQGILALQNTKGLALGCENWLLSNVRGSQFLLSVIA